MSDATVLFEALLRWGDDAPNASDGAAANQTPAARQVSPATTAQAIIAISEYRIPSAPYFGRNASLSTPMTRGPRPTPANVVTKATSPSDTVRMRADTRVAAIV